MERITFNYDNKRFDVRGNNIQDIIRKSINKVLNSQSEEVIEKELFSDWCWEWLELYKQPSTSERTYASYVQRIKKHLIPVFGDKYLCEISPMLCQKFFSSLVGYAQNTIRKIYNDLHQILEKAVKLNKISCSPLDDVEIPKGHSTTRRTITNQERRIILSVAEYHPAGMYMKVMLYCGVRPHEASIIQGKDIKGNVLHVRGTKNKASNRYVPIPDVFLKDIPKLNDEDYLITWNGKKTTEIDRAVMWKSFRKEMSKSVYISEDLVPYCLRHTYCTDLQDAGVPINVAKEFMGHCTINLTSKIYTHASEKSFNNAMGLINLATQLPH